MKKEQLEVIRDAIDHYGSDAQLNKATEELSELLVAIFRFNKQKNIATVNNLAEECADVEIMCKQFRKIVGSKLVDNYVDKKIERLKNRINAVKPS